MPGFYIGDKDADIILKNEYPQNCIAQQLDLACYTVKRNTLNKFLLDKVFVQNEHYAVVVEGYLLNKMDLFKKYGQKCMEELLPAMYEENGEKFFSEFRGGCSGALYITREDRWLIWTNHTGDAPIFYSTGVHFFCVGSQVNYLLDALKHQKIPLHLNEAAAYQMLTFGFMKKNDTFSKEIQRLRGGTYIVYKNGELKVKEYHRFKKNPERFQGMSDEELIELIDKAFLRAIRMEYEKDREYGYKHLADLSGGLDSRMNVWCAEELGYHPIQTITYCKANYLDEIIAKQIAGYWKTPILVKPLDDVQFLRDVDTLVRMLNGLSLYPGITGGKALLESLNMEQYGLEHTGMLGDVVVGSYLKSENDKFTGMYSTKLKERLPDNNMHGDYELYLLYSRGFRGVTNTYLLRQNYTEVSSPFLDVDFFQMCMDIPVEKRRNHHLYKRWIVEKHPEAAQFIWEATGCKVGDNKVKIQIKRIIKKGPGKLARLLHLPISVLESQNMNPLDYWIETNTKLQQDLAKMFEEHFAKLPSGTSEQLKGDISFLFNSGNAIEKSMAMTVVAACAYFFGEENHICKE